MKGTIQNITPTLCEIGQLTTLDNSTINQNLDLSLTEEPRNIGEIEENVDNDDVSNQSLKTCKVQNRTFFLLFLLF